LAAGPLACQVSGAATIDSGGCFREKSSMNFARRTVRFMLPALVVTLGAATAWAQATQKPFEPQVGQAGKDVVWVPTPQTLVDKMLDMAKVTPQDFVMDLGSGDGRTVITAAKRGARAMGIEYNPDMVALSERNAKTAGVTDKATFVKADLFETDFSKATVVTMFLLPSINLKLRPKILDMKPGTRIVANSFNMEDWEADETETVGGDCTSWCTALLWIVPAKVEGTWTTPKGDLKLTQQFQKVTGSFGTQAISEGKLRGDELTFKAGGNTYTGKVEGNMIHGSGWMATKKG
jgi:precorrin-6B methylase 2